MKNQNDIMKRQVQIDVQVLNVDVNAEDNYGINWKLALSASNANFSINGQAVNQAGSGGSASSSGSTGTGGISGITPIFIPSSTTQAFTIGTSSGSLSGSQLVINALSSVNKTSLVTSTAVTTLSNQPVPVQFVDQQAYLASVQNTISGQSSLSQTTLTPGQLTTGFSLSLLPVVQGDGMVYMQLSINISVLKNMAQYSTNGASLQLPNTLQRNLMQKAVVRSGDTFVVTSFDSGSQELTNSGVGGAYNWLFGGGVSANKSRTRMVILVTPRVVNM
jgi:type IVB pilus formation R64 PilN family outer membrane protein